MKYFIFILAIVFALTSCQKQSVDPNHEISIDSVFINGVSATNGSITKDIDYENINIKVVFNEPVDTSQFKQEKIAVCGQSVIQYHYKFDGKSKRLTIIPDSKLLPLTLYRLIVDQGHNFGGLFYTGFDFPFRTRLDTTPKFPKISEDSLLTLVQKKTFAYFWDYGHPVSGLSRERFSSGETVTSGGSGFGLMALLVGIKRGFITRQEGFERLSKIVTFLSRPETNRFHGAFPHWMNGTTGKVIPFSSKDNGGDLVETAYLMEGLLTVREYFRNGTSDEINMCQTITKLWEEVEWDWYRKDNQNILFWHWSPDKGHEYGHFGLE
jgi:hypothetical protein